MQSGEIPISHENKTHFRTTKTQKGGIPINCDILPSFWDIGIQFGTCASDTERWKDGPSLQDTSHARRPSGNNGKFSETSVSSNLTSLNSVQHCSQYHFRTTMCQCEAYIVG